MNAVIGIDTSCYTTSCAAVDQQGEVVAFQRKLLPVAPGQRGLRQSEALYIHLRQLPDLMDALMKDLKAYPDLSIQAVCASTKPRDDEDSYMPVFLAGMSFARTMASVLRVPFYSTTHQRGHLYAARLFSGIGEGTCLFLHLSGGTTELLLFDADSDTLSLIGGTLDLHAGQLVDRCGVALGLPFPAGPYLEELARKGKAEACLPVSMEQHDLYCHLSGAETRIQQLIREGGMSREQIAAEVYDLLARTVSRLVLAGKEKTGIDKVLIAGGVASSPLFREKLHDRVMKRGDMQLFFGKPEYSGDNAAGVACIGRKYLQEEEQKRGRNT